METMQVVESKQQLNNGDEKGKSPVMKDEVGQPKPKTTQAHHQSSFCRQSSSIYSLTMEEFQQSLFDTSKNLGSMNMDEFLNSICAAGENEQHQIQSIQTNPQLVAADTKTTQPSLTSQGSLTLPAPLSLKTVEEVWSEMSRDDHHHQQHQQQQMQMNQFNRQSTLGEMTLEDFLIKAGVVRETTGGSSLNPLQKLIQPDHDPSSGSAPHNYPIYPGNSAVTDPGFGFGPMAGVEFHGNDASAFSQGVGGGGLVVGDSKTTTNSSNFQAPGSWTGGYGAGMINPGGLLTGQHAYNSASHRAELEIGARKAGRKRTAAEGPVEKVVERRQRRMIKNREAASRSRARKQAYTVELEAALDKLKEENARLISQALIIKLQEKKAERGLKKNKVEMPRMAEKMKVLRRMWSSPLMA